MSFIPRMRPDFTAPLDTEGRDFLRLLQNRLSEPDCPLEGQVLGGHASIRLPESERSMLSPYLELELVGEHGHEQVHGRFSPQPNVWTGFMALFGTLALLGLAGVIFGISKMMLGEGWHWLLAGPVSVALIAFVYGAAFIGQGLSTDDMFTLRSYVQALARGDEPGSSPPHLRSKPD